MLITLTLTSSELTTNLLLLQAQVGNNIVELVPIDS